MATTRRERVKGSPITRAFALAGALSVVASAAVAVAPSSAYAAPEAHILRIDPRASQTEGAPVLTTVVELVQPKAMSEALAGCASQGEGELECTGNALEKPQALWSPVDFPDARALMTVTVDGTAFPADFVSKESWAEAVKKKEDGAGTAWLIIIDASNSMEKHFDDERAVAHAFVNSMGPSDIAYIEYIGDRGSANTPSWVEKAQANAAIDGQSHVISSGSSSRPLGSTVRQAISDGFTALGNSPKVKVPMHQALVVMSDGLSGLDAGTNGPVATQIRGFLTKGRFPEDNSEALKTPVPVISIIFPVTPAAFTGKEKDAEVNQARDFMQQLPNPEIGGLFGVVNAGQGSSRGANIAAAVHARFDKMWVIKWKIACVGSDKTQTFKLDFKDGDPKIVGDGTFDKVPIGIDPTLWPLDVDVEKTKAYAEKNPIYPGGKLKVFGNFCWSGKKERAELYMIPKNQVLPDSVSGSIDDAKKAQQSLIESGMHAVADAASETSAEFTVPDNPKFLITKDQKAFTTRLIIYDNGGHRTSAITQDKVITLKASQPPTNLLLYGGAAFGGTVVLLLLITVFRSGGKRRGGGMVAAPPPRPASPGIPAPAPMPMPMPAAPAAPAPSFVSRATLTGAQGIFTVLPSMEMKAGRDGAVCQILLSEPRVSGAHATLKIDGGQLMVRDDNSNNGTMVNGTRIPPGAWTPVPQSAQLRFGPVEFSVNLE